MKQYSFNIDKITLQEFTDSISSTNRSSIIRDFIKNEYRLPEINSNEFHSLFEHPQDSEIILFRLDDVSNELVDELVIEANELNTNKITNRSAIMRNIMQNLVEKNKRNTSQIKKIRKSFIVPKGTITQLKNYVSHGERDELINRFILNDYQGCTINTKELKSRSKGENETLLVTLSDEALNKLEQIAESIGDKVKVSHIFKDVIKHLLKHLECNKQIELEQKLADTISDLKKYVDTEKIKEMIEKYTI